MMNFAGDLTDEEKYVRFFQFLWYLYATPGNIYTEVIKSTIYP